MFGGNSNWRGPIWFPVNLLLIRALLQFYASPFLMVIITRPEKEEQAPSPVITISAT